MAASAVRSIQLTRVGFTYGGRAIFDDVSFRLEPGWAAVVGENGSGKSTLIRLLAGDLAPTQGALVRPDLGVERCRQEVEENDLGGFGEAWDKRAMQLRDRFALDIDQLLRWPTLSPGERKRWQVAAALHRDPEVLLLDEPTNHLDAAARAMLLEALRAFTGIGVIVSHDRDLLDALAPRTLWIEGGTVRVLSLGYSEARAAIERERAAASSLADKRARAVKRAERQLQQKREAQAAAEGQRSSAARMKGPRDHDARSGLAKGLSEMASAQLSQQVGALGARLERAKDARRAVRIRKPRGGVMKVDHDAGAPETLIRLVGAVTAGSLAEPVLADVSCVVRRDSRIHLAGPNGAGKSSLLRALEDTIGWPRARLLVLPQELDRAARRAVADDLRGTGASARGAWLARAVALGVDPEVLESPLPSPGEARKLVLARAIAEGAWCLFLDEPENHLDVPSIERLEAALDDFAGAIVLVTHDARLARTVCDETWRIEGTRLVVNARDEQASLSPASPH